MDLAAGVAAALAAAGEAFGPAPAGAPQPRWGALYVELDDGADAAFATDIELIFEGYLLHYRESRALALAPGDLETRLLAGDCFYARGLRGIAARGDADAVGLLARLMAACSYLRGAGAPFAADDALWAYTTAGLVAQHAGAEPGVRRGALRRRRGRLPRRPARRCAGSRRVRGGASHPVRPCAAAARARSRRREVTVDLRAFISLLEREGELARVRPEVDPYLEMAEIADRASKAHGPAVLFEQPKRPAGQPAVPVLMNQLGSYRRLELALGAPLDDIAKRIGGLLELQVPSGLVGKVKALGQLKELASYGPQVRQEGRVARGRRRPAGPRRACRCSPRGPATAVPSSRCRSSSPRTSRAARTPACTACRSSTARRPACTSTSTTTARPTSARRATAWRWRSPSAPTRRSRMRPRRRSRRASASSCSPASCAASRSRWRSAPPSTSQVPADAEIVLEGYVEKGETRLEGPFGDHTGYYSLADQYPVFHVTAMSHRRDPIYPATIVGKPPMEDSYLGKATERLFLPLLQLVQPEIVDMDLPIEGVFHDCAIISIRKEYPGHARKIMNAVWGMGQMMFTKFVVVVDEDVDVHDYSEVTWRVFNNVDPERDTVIMRGPLDVLDHSSPFARYGAKMGIDATKTWPDEGHAREWPEELAMDPAVVRRVDARWKELGLPFS